MAKVIYIYSREVCESGLEDKLRGICDRLSPEHIEARRSRVEVGEHWAVGIANPSDAVEEKDGALLMGAVLEGKSPWYEVGKEAPDGSYVIFRRGGQEFEVITDPVASRTVWVYRDDMEVVVSTSQRAMVLYLESFQFNHEVIPWMLSTGSLGPGLSWDRRFRPMGPDTTLRIKREDWVVEQESRPIEFEVVERSRDEHKKRLRAALEACFQALEVDFGEWALPLSGGYDSRAILCFLKEQGRDLEELQVITWGLKSALNEPGTDAYVAKQLADFYEVDFRYFNTDISEEPVEVLLERFLLCGEGRIDHIAGYMDGFDTWKKQFQSGVLGVIRGDEGFGWNPVSSPLTVRLSTSCALCTDFSNLKDYQEFGLAEQNLPEELKRQEDESLEKWRDRIYHQFRGATALAALTDLKTPYVELINPLMARRILKVVRELPDDLRTSKALFREIVDEVSPDIGYATKAATALPRHILKRPEMARELRRELESGHAKSVLPEVLVDRVLEDMRVEGGVEEAEDGGRLTRWKRRLRAMIIRFLPQSVKNRLQDHVIAPSVDPNVLAFRLYIVSRMTSILESAAGQPGQ